jgi:aspartate aminotransferase
MSADLPLDLYINLNVRGLRLSATVAINERCNALRAQGREVFKLGLGQSPFPVPQTVVESLRVNAAQKDYLPVRGLASLREAVADYHRRTQGVAASPENVLIAPGSKELMFLLQVVFYGDLLIPTPSWVSYAPQAHIVGKHIHWLHTRAEDEWRLLPETLDAHCRHDSGRPRILILNDPDNPTGGSYEGRLLTDLAAVARRHRVIVLSDEIYAELHHRGLHQSIARHYPEGTIISSGLSKWCGAGGWRLGTFLFPPSLKRLLDAMAAVASETYTSTSAPIQHAAVAAFRGGLEIERYLVTARRVLAALGGWIAARLTEAGARVSPPRGAFYLFPDFSPLRERLKVRGVRDSREFCETLLEQTGVAILPGADFGRPVEELTCRLAYVDFDGAKAMQLAEAHPQDLGREFLGAACTSTVTAIERLCDWLAG